VITLAPVSRVILQEERIWCEDKQRVFEGKICLLLIHSNRQLLAVPREEFRSLCSSGRW
jgi:hypothetical protein